MVMVVGVAVGVGAIIISNLCVVSDDMAKRGKKGQGGQINTLFPHQTAVNIH